VRPCLQIDIYIHLEYIYVCILRYIVANKAKEWAGSKVISLPGSSTQGSDPSLENASKKGERVFPGHQKVNQGEKYAPVDDEAHDHCYHVHPQLPSNHF
jgi:hypothetical protein